MIESVDNIPTLTDIIQVGDPSMLNHFDAHQLNETQAKDSVESSNEDAMQEMTPTASIIEPAAIFDNLETKHEEVPSIKIIDEQHIDIADEDFSDSMQAINEDNFNSHAKAAPSEETPLDNDVLKEKINQAVKDILPDIETHLKEQLYKQFDL